MHSSIPNAADIENWQVLSSQGDVSAQSYLAHCLMQGIGVEKDEVHAVSLYQQAAEKGNAVSQFALAYCYQYGIGIETNHSLAAKFYQLAADQVRRIDLDFFSVPHFPHIHHSHVPALFVFQKERR